jgi:hypothetical protein
MNISKEVKLVNTNRQAIIPMDSSRKTALAGGHTLPADLCLDPDRLSLQC